MKKQRNSASGGRGRKAGASKRKTNRRSASDSGNRNNNDKPSDSSRSGRSGDPAGAGRNRPGKNRGRNDGRHHRHIPESLRQYVTGTVDMKSSGKAYLLPDNKEIADVFIAANHTKHALGGDRVRVLLFPHRGSVGKLEGQVVEILQRNKNYIVGIVERSGAYYFLVPDNPSVPVDIFLPKETLKDAKAGEKVVVRITDWPPHLNNPVGEVMAVLGQPGDNHVEMQSILADYNFPLAYPEAAEAEARKMKDEVTVADLKQRRDFREVYTCTIDPADAKDFDDALSFRRLDDGQVEVGVHIADVSHFVKPGSAIDREAYDRATSVYLVDRTIAMLPERLSNDLCSLRADVERFTFSAVFKMKPETAEVTDFWFGKGVIRSNRRFAYEQVQAVLEKAGLTETFSEAAEKAAAPKPALKTDEKEALTDLFRLSQKLKTARYAKGAINFHSQEVRFHLDPVTAKPLGVYIKEQKEANFLVEEFMLLANRYVAEWAGKRKKPFVYRVHDEPNPEKLNTFVEFVRKLGYKMNTRSRSGLVKSFNTLLDAVAGKAEQNMIETISVRTMAKAYYSSNNIGHYGLAFKYYTHFTSPIRRYPDLMVHRLLEHYLGKGEPVDLNTLEERCEHSSEMERRAAEAERASVKYKQAEYLSDKVGEYFYGLVSGVSKWGIYVALEGNYCEGMVPLRSLTDDFYELDEENYRVVGVRTGQSYKLGDRVRIRVDSVDMNKKQMNFSF